MSDGHEPVRIAPLDGLRGIAVLAVIVFHACVFERTDSALGAALLSVARAGWSGVDLFFVLSGFLITGILLDGKGASNYFRAFYARRFLRIFPLYYLSLAVLVAAYRVSAAESAWYWLYLSNFRMTSAGWPQAPLSHFWSLAVEEQYYLIWPLVVFLAPRKVLSVLCGAVVILVPAARVTAWILGAPEIGLYILAPFRLDALATGSLLALLLRAGGAAERIRKAGGVGLVLSGVVLASLLVREGGDAMWTNPAMLTLGFTVVSLFFGSLVALAVTVPSGTAYGRVLSAKALRLAGKYSYAMYVFHWPVTTVLRERGLHPGLVPGVAGWGLYLGVIVGAVTLLAIVSWRLLEGPCLSLKDRFEYRFPERIQAGKGPSQGSTCDP